MKLEDLSKMPIKSPIWVTNENIDFLKPIVIVFPEYAQYEIESLKAEHWDDGFGDVLVAILKAGD